MWTKYFRPVNSVLPQQTQGVGGDYGSSAINKFSSWLPEFYQGPPNRLMRYQQYETMDLDHEVNAALDIMADFSSHLDVDTGLPFEIHYHDEASPSEKEILMNSLKQWCRLNEFPRRIFRIFRSTLLYGDQFFIRDPETYKLYWVDPSTVDKVIVNESEGKKIEGYYVRELDLNLQELTSTNVMKKTQMGYNSHDNVFPNAPYTGQANYATGTAAPMITTPGQPYTSGEAFPVDSEHVVHLSLTEGMNNSWPFGISVLEPIFKVYKQKELLEDSILIYRVHRAPERRVFFIDVGTMPPNKASQYLERIKNEVQQKRIPSRTGGGQNIADSAYNPMCLSLSTEVPLLDGRVLTLDTLIYEYEEGKENWAYSCDPVTGKVVPGPISWAGVTRKDSNVIKVTLDNGQSFTCTEDHKIPVLGKGFIEAKDLTPEDLLVSKSTSKHDGQDCRITSIEYLSEREDVGTLTIDQEEKYHKHHTFALNSGIFVKNSMLEDYFFATTAEGRGSKVETLPGGENLGQIDDLKYFNNKMLRGLGVPSAYLPTGPEDGTNTFNDGRLGTAMIQEYRFTKTCMRYQRQMISELDKEFKLFLKYRGITIDSSLFEIAFLEPQNFSKYRQVEIDAAYANNFNAVKDTPYISKRYALERYLGWTEDEIQKNERLWKEEQGYGQAPDEEEGASSDLRSVGVQAPPEDMDIEDEDFGIPDEGEAAEGGEEGGEAPEGGGEEGGEEQI